MSTSIEQLNVAKEGHFDEISVFTNAKDLVACVLDFDDGPILNLRTARLFATDSALVNRANVFSRSFAVAPEKMKTLVLISASIGSILPF